MHDLFDKACALRAPYPFLSRALLSIYEWDVECDWSLRVDPWVAARLMGGPKYFKGQADPYDGSSTIAEDVWYVRTDNSVWQARVCKDFGFFTDDLSSFLRKDSYKAANVLIERAAAYVRYKQSNVRHRIQNMPWYNNEDGNAGDGLGMGVPPIRVDRIDELVKDCNEHIRQSVSRVEQALNCEQLIVVEMATAFVRGDYRECTLMALALRSIPEMWKGNRLWATYLIGQIMSVMREGDHKPFVKVPLKSTQRRGSECIMSMKGEEHHKPFVKAPLKNTQSRLREFVRRDA